MRERTLVGLRAVIILLLAPVIAFALAAFLNLDGPKARVCMIQATVPTAVFTSVLHEEFDARSAAVRATVLVATLGSVLTLACLLWMLNGAS